MERAINEADAGDVITVPDLADELEAMPSGRRGAKVLRKLLQPATFSLTDSELERRFIPIARQAGLPRPQTQATVNGFRVDFYFEELGLIVETDGATYHRTPTQQTRDRVRDQAHTAAGLTPLRFTHEQIAGTPGYVEETLRTVTARLIRAAARGPGASRPLPSPRVRAASA